MRILKANGVLQHRITYLAIVFKEANDDLTYPRLHEANSHYFEFRKSSFGVWLNAQAIRIKGRNPSGSLVVFDISRETMVRRVANAMGGSHPIGGHEMNDINDPIIRELMSTQIFKIPLPYLILLKMAQDILNAFK